MSFVRRGLLPACLGTFGFKHLLHSYLRGLSALRGSQSTKRNAARPRLFAPARRRSRLRGWPYPCYRRLSRPVCCVENQKPHRNSPRRTASARRGTTIGNPSPVAVVSPKFHRCSHAETPRRREQKRGEISMVSQEFRMANRGTDMPLKEPPFGTSPSSFAFC